MTDQVETVAACAAAEPHPAKPRRAPRKSLQDSLGYRHALYKMWHLAYLDRGAFGQASVQLSQQDVLHVCNRSQKTPGQGAYVVPVQPSLPLSPGNAVIVDKLQRRFLLALWRLTEDEDAYKGCMKALMKMD